MPRLVRPHIPIKVRCIVAARQHGFSPSDLQKAYKAIARCCRQRGAGKLLFLWLRHIADGFGCRVKDLHLDHNPALGAREKVYKGGVHVDYIPPANDPGHLFYRPHGPQFDGSHLIKTNVRGENGQHPDRVLIKKQRRLEEREGLRPARASDSRPKARLPKRKLRSANRWPPRGSRKIQNRKK